MGQCVRKTILIDPVISIHQPRKGDRIDNEIGMRL